MAERSYLISFVKCLLENDNTVIQEENKRKLEAEYNLNGTSLNKNLAGKYEQVSQILAVYKYISERVKSNRAGVAIIKNNLTQCKQLLQCNRDDLRRLWLELIEKRNCVKLLDSLEEVRLAPELVTSLTEAKRWTDATLTVLTATSKLNDGLKSVVAVKTVDYELTLRTKTLIDRLKANLHKLTFSDIMQFALQNLNPFGDRRASERNYMKKVNLSTNEDNTEPDRITMNYPYSNLSLSNWRDVPIENDFWSEKRENFDIKTISKHLVTEDKSKSEESQLAQNIIYIMFSLNEFNKLQEVLNEWSVSNSQPLSQSSDEPSSLNEDHIRFLRKEVHKLIVLKSMEHIKRSAMSQNYGRLDNFADCRYLLELLDLLYVTLLQCQSALLLINKVVNYLINSRKVNISLHRYDELHIYFDESSIRNMIQTELKSVLREHLKISGKDLLLNGVTDKYEDEFKIPSQEVLIHHLGKKKGLLGSVSVIQSNVPAPTHSSGISDNSSNYSKQSLFKFSHSSHALSVSACLQEMRPLTINIDTVDKVPSNNNQNDVVHYPLVCKPHHNNIISIYGSIMEFVETLEAEEYLNQPLNTKKKPCILRTYIHNFIDRVFLEESLKEMNGMLNSTFKEYDCIKGLQNLVSQADEREFGLQRPIIAVMLTADKCLEEIKRITAAINHYSIPCLNNGFKVMNEFTENLWDWFRMLSSLDSSQETHMSTEWGKDKDLIRFWKGLSSWQKMTNIDMKENDQINDHSNLNVALHSSISINDGFLYQGTDFSNKQFKILSGNNDTTNDALMEERKARLQVDEESNHVMKLIEEELNSQKGLKSQKTPKFAVFQKNELIKQMGRLHESVTWFVQRTSRFQTWLVNKSWLKTGDDKKIILDDKQDLVLNEVIKNFTDLHNKLIHLADACLISIHHEGRLRAYNFITHLPFEAHYGAQLDEVDVDPQVSELVKSLNDLGFSLTHTLTRHKFRFVFEGLGNFVSALLVQILPKIKIMSTSGIKKMCRNIYLIQQTLSVLTQTHEMDLVRVKQLYELLHISPEAVVNRIMEQGPVYNESVYRSVLNLYQLSHTLYDNEKLQEAIMRLCEVMNTAQV